MRTKYDVAVVGGRVAGTSLAIRLTRLGMSVAIFDRAELPGDTMSTHVIYPNTIARLEHLGVLDRIMAHRPPPLYTSSTGRSAFAAPRSIVIFRMSPASVASTSSTMHPSRRL